MTTITNTTVLTNFAAIGQLDLLRQLFGQLYLPVEVYDEIRTGMAEGYTFYNNIPDLIHPFVPTGWLCLTNINDEAQLRDLKNLPANLHAGEAACLIIARHRRWLLLTDDRAARKAAAAWGIALSGTIGCLVMAVERQICSLSDANDYLRQMSQMGYYAPYTDLTPLLHQA